MQILPWNNRLAGGENLRRRRHFRSSKHQT